MNFHQFLEALRPQKGFHPAILKSPYLTDCRMKDTPDCWKSVYHRVASEMMFSENKQLWTLNLN